MRASLIGATSFQTLKIIRRASNGAHIYILEKSTLNCQEHQHFSTVVSTSDFIFAFAAIDFSFKALILSQPILQHAFSAHLWLYLDLYCYMLLVLTYDLSWPILLHALSVHL